MNESATPPAREIAEIIARASLDGAFRSRLINNPRETIEWAGGSLPDGVTIRIVEDTEAVVHVVLPAKPDNEELSLEELDQAAGGFALTVIEAVATVAMEVDPSPYAEAGGRTGGIGLIFGKETKAPFVYKQRFKYGQ